MWVIWIASPNENVHHLFTVNFKRTFLATWSNYFTPLYLKNDHKQSFIVPERINLIGQFLWGSQSFVVFFFGRFTGSVRLSERSSARCSTTSCSLPTHRSPDYAPVWWSTRGRCAESHPLPGTVQIRSLLAMVNVNVTSTIVQCNGTLTAHSHR